MIGQNTREEIFGDLSRFRKFQDGSVDSHLWKHDVDLNFILVQFPLGASLLTKTIHS